MLPVMGKKRKSSEGKGAKPPRLVLFVSLTRADEDALQAYIAEQDVSPDRSAVGLKALHEFLAKRGHWPPKSPRA
jgi:hypothetical protein